MMLVEVTTVPQAVLPVAAFKEHLRLGTGFSDADIQDGLLEAHLRAALAAIEARTGKILIARDFRWSLGKWRDADCQPLPVAPVAAIASVVMVDAAGVEITLPDSRWALVPDAHRPQLAACGPRLPEVPQGGTVQITMTAGYGADWTDLPDDLAQAVLMLAAHYYEHRHAVTAQPQGLPEPIQALIAGYRSLRLFMGGGYA